jgi:hypothetical protein
VVNGEWHKLPLAVAKAGERGHMGKPPDAGRVKVKIVVAAG